MNKSLKQSGFTLIELAITLIIAAIVLAASAPSFREAIVKNRVTTQINDLSSTLNLARSEAIKRSTTIAVCKSIDGSSCATTGNWEDGWIVFVNTDADSPAVRDGGEQLLRVFPAIGSDHTLRASAGLTTEISFTASGESTASGHFVLCSKDEDISDSALIHHARAVYVNAIGRTVRAPDRNKNGIPEIGSGADITTCTPV